MLISELLVATFTKTILEQHLKPNYYIFADIFIKMDTHWQMQLSQLVDAFKYLLLLHCSGWKYTVIDVAVLRCMRFYIVCHVALQCTFNMYRLCTGKR